MTDAVQGGTEWVPRFGMLEVPTEHAALIRALFELAAFVADHPELPLPDVKARFFGPFGDDAAARYAAALGLVEELSEALDAKPTEADGRVEVEAWMGPVRVFAIAYSPESWAEFEARNSYTSNVITAAVVGGAR